jgi:hypothetical protein
VKKRNLKAIFLGLLSRRRVVDESPLDPGTTGATPDGAAARSRIGPAESNQKAPSASAEGVSETGDRITRKPPGPPADWLAKRSSGPPTHWVERVRLADPALLQNLERDEAGATAPPQPTGQIQLGRTPAPPPQSRRPAQAPPLRLQKPAPSPRPIGEPEQSGRGMVEFATDGPGRPESRRQESPAPTYFVDAQKGDTDDGGTNCQIVPRAQLQADLGLKGLAPSESTQIFAPEAQEILTGSESPQMSSAPTPPRNIDKAAVAPLVLPPDNVRRPSGTEPHSQTWVDSSELIQSSRNSDEPAFSRVEPVASGAPDHCRSSDEHEATPGIPIISAATAQFGEFSVGQNTEQENVVRYPDGIRREIRRSAAGYEQLPFISGYRQGTKNGVTKREEGVTQPVGLEFAPESAADLRVTPYGVSAGRWPALFDATPEDCFDDLPAAWRELNHNRRLDREQAGDLWSE